MLAPLMIIFMYVSRFFQNFLLEFCWRNLRDVIETTCPRFPFPMKLAQSIYELAKRCWVKTALRSRTFFVIFFLAVTIFFSQVWILTKKSSTMWEEQINVRNACVARTLKVLHTFRIHIFYELKKYKKYW
jgi:hypothetical protein